MCVCVCVCVCECVCEREIERIKNVQHLGGQNESSIRLEWTLNVCVCVCVF